MSNELAEKIYDKNYYFEFVFKLMTYNMSLVRDPEKRKDLDTKIQILRAKIAEDPMLFLYYTSTELTERDRLILNYDEDTLHKEIYPFIDFLTFLQHPKLNSLEQPIKQIKGYDSFFIILKELDLEEFWEFPRRRY